MKNSRFEEILANFGKLSPILVAGDVGVDKYTFGQVLRISPEAPVPVVDVEKTQFKLGLAANICDNLRTLGVPSVVLSVVGEDFEGDLLEDLLEDMQLKTWGLIRVAGRKTTLKERVLTKGQQICRIDYEQRECLEENVQQSVLNRLKDLLPEHGCLILQDYGKGFFDGASIQKIIGMGQAQGKRVYVDPYRGADPLVYRGAFLLKPNEIEAKLMAERLGYREQSPKVWASILMDKLELNKVVITLGSRGMGLLEKEHPDDFILIKTQATEVFDVSGAGDTAISVICAAIETGANLQEACWLGNLAAGVVVGKRGTATVCGDELRKLYGKADLQL